MRSLVIALVGIIGLVAMILVGLVAGGLAA
jgi:hypothetical protein